MNQRSLRGAPQLTLSSTSWRQLSRYALLILFVGACESEESAPLEIDQSIIEAASEDQGAPLRARCETPLEVLTLSLDNREYEIFRYEASHPESNLEEAYPGSAMREDTPSATLAEPCSLGGVIPWHSIRWSEAEAACEAIGWRLCSSAELTFACGGDESYRYAWGDTYEGGICNLLGVYSPGPEQPAQASPCGLFEECESPTGGVDLNGNLWEWSADRDSNDARARHYQGGGWAVIAERHMESEQQCDSVNVVRGIGAASFRARHLGFRCCRDR